MKDHGSSLMKDPRVFLKHILESINCQDAVVRRFEIIGEAARNLSEEYKDEHADIEWRKAMAMRNILSHGYFGVDLRIAWEDITPISIFGKRHVKIF